MKARAPVYQNFGYQLWKQQEQQKRTYQEPEEEDSKSALFSSVPLNIPLGLPAIDDPRAPVSPRKKISDSNLETFASNVLRKQIRGYMSSTALPGPNKFSPVLERRPVKAERTGVMRISGSTLDSGSGSRKSSQALENFPSFTPEAQRKPQLSPQFSPISKPGLESTFPRYRVPHAASTTPSTSQPTSEQQNMMYVYPQSYTPIYIPIIVQPNVGASGNYGYNSGSEMLTGRIKFFDEAQNYGFFTLDCNGSDLFVHYDDLLKSGITKDYLQVAKAMNVRFAFRCVSYYGKYNLSYKAVDIQVLHDPASNFSVPQ